MVLVIERQSNPRQSYVIAIGIIGLTSLVYNPIISHEMTRGTREYVDPLGTWRSKCEGNPSGGGRRAAGAAQAAMAAAAKPVAASQLGEQAIGRSGDLMTTAR